MSLQAKAIGIGQAGNKAVIALVEGGVLAQQDILLLNSTLKDVPDKYKELAIEFGETKGCGKDRALAKRMILGALEDGSATLDSFMGPNDTMVIIATSSEGGTGCGASSVVAEYMTQIIGTKVHMCVFTGFEDDARGLKNTVDWFNDLSDEDGTPYNYIVEAISNKKFLDDCGGDKLKAEEAANEEFVRRVNILLGTDIVPSEKNIDDTDLFKLTTTPGYMTIETAELGKVKSKEAFNACLNEMIINSKSLDTEQSAKRIGVILNISPKSRSFIDPDFSEIKTAYGTPYELFTHIQYVQDTEFISIIVSGMKMPSDEVKRSYNNFKKLMESIDRSKDKFFDNKFDTKIGIDDELSDIEGSSSFGPTKDPDKVAKAKNSFFEKYGKSKPQTQTLSKENKSRGKFNNITLAEDEL